MRKLSFQDVLGYGGVILALLTPVLDKTGLLNKTTLIIMLIVAAPLTLPLGLNLTWIANAPKRQSVFRRMLAIVVVGVLLWGGGFGKAIVTNKMMVVLFSSKG